MRERMGKQILLCLLIVAATVFGFSVPVRADTGPKPSVKIRFDGLGEEPYYATLLAEDDSYGPWSAGSPYEDWLGEEAIWEKYAAYEDADGYYFWGVYEECSKTDLFVWSYYPPETFKILLYFPGQDSFLVSGICERYAFDSCFTMTIGENGKTEVAKTYDYTGETVSLVARILITIALELGIAWLFFYRSRKQLLVICLTNVVTQTILNVLLNLINYNSGIRAFVINYIGLECLVFVLEGCFYAAVLKRLKADPERKLHPWLYALTANAVSFGAGLLISHLIPGIF